MNLEIYQRDIKGIDIKSANEASYRTALENLLNSIEIIGKNIKVIQEARDKHVDGTPDFHIYEDPNEQFNQLIGFMECKKITADIEKIIASEQIKKYAKTTDNIIITNYKKFILLQKYNGKIEKKAEVILLDENCQLQGGIKRLKEQFKIFYFEFISYEYPYINTKQRLVEELARRSFDFSFEIRKELENKDSAFSKEFKKLFDRYSVMLHYNYKREEFCDIYAQSFVYGLLISRLDNSSLKYSEVNDNYIRYIPEEYRILREFLSTLLNPAYMRSSFLRVLWQVAKYLNLIDIPAIQAEFERTEDGRNSIIVYLYEDFLKEFDKLRESESRKENGVYYTPREVVDFIVRNVNLLIKNKLGKKSGFLEDKLKVLDFATGTGSFLESIIHKMGEKVNDDLGKEIFKKKILEDLYGFELQFTPYIVAHIVLTKALESYDIKLNEEENLGIYIANTIDLDPVDQENSAEYLIEETEKANTIKQRENILVIVGNPPYYNGTSPNASKEMENLLKDYKKNLNETRHNLNDLYIQFIRFAEHKIGQHEEGIVGIITNNSFLSGINHRKMRRHLFETFDEIYVLNLHGEVENSSTEDNVFDIMVGVCITFFIRKKGKTDKKISYYSILDSGAFSRSEKFNFLNENNIDTIDWIELKNRDDNLFFVERNYAPIYSKFINMDDIFHSRISGLSSSRNHVCISYSKGSQKAIANDFIKLDEGKIRQKYGKKDKGVWQPLSDGRNWELSKAIADIKANNIDENYRIIHYRPFDFRWSFISMKPSGFYAWPRKELTKQMVNNNYALTFTRGVANNFSHGFVSRDLPEYSMGGSSTKAVPLYLYKTTTEDRNKNLDFGKKGVANFTEYFKNFLKGLNFEPTPEEVIAYIYSIFHSPIYRREYADSLKDDFPAIPFTKSEDIFYQYADFGQKLVDLHLLKNDLVDDAIKVNFKNMDNFIIEKIGKPKDENDTLILYGKDENVITFHGISEKIYTHEICGYKPIHKWLKYRKKDKVILDIEDMSHLKNIIVIIKRTIELMEEIENLGEAYLENL